jgi:broad specificity phosphatase PhoE
MRKIFIMRHGAVENPDRILYGTRPGFHLSEEGKGQAREAGEFMERFPIDIVISSSLERASETAHLVADNNSGKPKFGVDDRIIDGDFGKYVGMDVKEFDNNRQHYLELQLAHQDGMEHPQAVADRMMAAVSEALAQHPDQTILFVSHGDPIAFFLAAVAGTDLIPAAIVHFPRKAAVYSVDLTEHKWENIFTPIGSKF